VKGRKKGKEEESNQGLVVQPLLGAIYLHHVIIIGTQWRKRKAIAGVSVVHFTQKATAEGVVRVNPNYLRPILADPVRWYDETNFYPNAWLYRPHQETACESEH
jgi:hypothetical protein